MILSTTEGQNMTNIDETINEAIAELNTKLTDAELAALIDEWSADLYED